MLFGMEHGNLRRTRIAAELRAELARQNKTKADLAQATGMSVATLQRRLAGVRPFYVDELDACTRFLGLPLTELLERAEAA